MIGAINQANTEPVTQTERRRFLRPVEFRWYLAPIWAAALYFSTHQAAKAILASAFLLHDSQLNELLATPERAGLEIQRVTQQHYLSYGIYIPLDDIVIYDPRQTQPSLVSLIQQSCGNGSVYVWVPLRLQLPFVGEKVLEWCLVKA